MPTRLVAIVFACLLCVFSGAACQAIDTRTAPAASSMPALPGQATGVLTTAHETFGGALNDFFMRAPEPVQPIDFPHNTHVKQGVSCTEYCHETVTKGPVAGLPSVKTCMICHIAIATDRPRIQQITALSDKGLDLNWQRVYGYPAQSHVKFNHAPHIRAKVDCAKCHGNIGSGTVATRNVDLTMGYCVTCHNDNNAPVDCLTCHY